MSKAACVVILVGSGPVASSRGKASAVYVQRELISADSTMDANDSEGPPAHLHASWHTLGPIWHDDSEPRDTLRGRQQTAVSVAASSREGLPTLEAGSRVHCMCPLGLPNMVAQCGMYRTIIRNKACLKQQISFPGLRLMYLSTSGMW